MRTLLIASAAALAFAAPAMADDNATANFGMNVAEYCVFGASEADVTVEASAITIEGGDSSSGKSSTFSLDITCNTSFDLTADTSVTLKNAQNVATSTSYSNSVDGTLALTTAPPTPGGGDRAGAYGAQNAQAIYTLTLEAVELTSGDYNGTTIIMLTGANKGAPTVASSGGGDGSTG